MWASAGEQHHADGRVFAGVGEGVYHLEDRFRAKRIALRRAVDRHLGDAVALVVEYVLVIADFLPVHGLKIVGNFLKKIGAESGVRLTLGA